MVIIIQMKHVMTEDVRDYYREIRKEFLAYASREQIPLLVLFKRLDANKDDFVSFTEFVKGLQEYFPELN